MAETVAEVRVSSSEMEYVNSPLRFLDPTKEATKNLQYPLDNSTKGFHTVFRIAKREVSFEQGQLNIAPMGNKEVEIFLPLPPNLGTAYGASYTGADLGLGGALFGGAAAVAGSVFDPGKMNVVEAAGAGGKIVYDATLGKVVDSFNKAETTLGGFGDAIGTAAEGLALFAARSALSSPIGAGIGIANNPYAAIVYQNPEFKTHSFSYTLFAKSKDESDQIRDIIKEFKKAMHPEFAGGGLFLQYPRVFQIEYIVGVENNEFIHKIDTSVLTSFSVNYHGDGTPSYFDSATPAPSNVQINMNFQELNFHTYEDFDKQGITF